MNLGIKLNLTTFKTATLTDDFSIVFDSITDLTNWDGSQTVDADHVVGLEMYYHDGEKYLGVETDNPVQQPEDEFYDDDVSRPAGTGGYIAFKCKLADTDLAVVLKLISLGIIELNQFGKTSVICYRLNDEADHMTKTLTAITIIEGKFTAPLGIKSLELDVVDYDIDNSYNYVYISKLKRYYYVSNPILTTKDYTKLVLQEDVLMSWKSLILQQSALVTRYGNASNKFLVDNRLPVEDVLRVVYPTITNTPIGTTNKNTTLSTTTTANEYNFMVSFMGLYGQSTPTVVATPTGTLLNSIDAVNSPYDEVEFLKYEDMGYFMLACHSDSESASYIKSVMYLPFDPKGVFFPSNQSTTQAIQVRTGKSLRTNYRFEPASDTEHAHVFGHRVTTRACPYIITADFTITDSTASNNFLDYEPNSNYEIYIAFVGWIHVNANQILGKRLMIYYTIDLETGSGTAYLYSVTDDKLIWSSNCQIGVKLDFVTSNALEISKQKSANELNTILNSIGGLLAMVGGGVSGNAIGVVGGALSLGKTVASSINLHNSLFQNAQISFGTSEGVIHTSFENNGVVVRKTYHRPVSATNISYSSTAYNKINGKPYNSYVKLSSLTTGYYIEVGEIHFDYGNENIYAEEVNEIVALLKNGVIL